MSTSVRARIVERFFWPVVGLLVGLKLGTAIGLAMHWAFDLHFAFFSLSAAAVGAALGMILRAFQGLPFEEDEPPYPE